MQTTTRVLWIATTLLCAAAALATGQTPPTEAPKQDRGETLVKEDCLTCHELNRIKLQFMDRAEWTKQIEKMVGLGAKVKPEDMPALVEYLAKTYGYQLPEGPGKDLFEKTCKGACHDVQRIVQNQWSRARWDHALEEMIANGADIADDDYDVLLNYLAKNFKPATP